MRNDSIKAVGILLSQILRSFYTKVSIKTIIPFTFVWKNSEMEL